MKDLIDAVADWKITIAEIRVHKALGKKKYHKFYKCKDQVDALVAKHKGTNEEGTAMAIANVEYEDIFPKST
jgi:hypothetical protein